MLLSASVRDLTNARPMDVAIVDGNGDQITSFTLTSEAPPSNATLTQPTINASTSVLLASNANRRRWTLQNDTGKVVFVAYAATASTTAFTIKIANGVFYESPLNDYTGVISAVTQSGSGTARVTEIFV